MESYCIVQKCKLIMKFRIVYLSGSIFTNQGFVTTDIGFLNICGQMKKHFGSDSRLTIPHVSRNKDFITNPRSKNITGIVSNSTQEGHFSICIATLKVFKSFGTLKKSNTLKSRLDWKSQFCLKKSRYCWPFNDVQLLKILLYFLIQTCIINNDFSSNHITRSRNH